MRKLKSILVYRRKAADMREMVKENSGEHQSHRRALDLNSAFEPLTKCAAESNRHASAHVENSVTVAVGVECCNVFFALRR